MGRVRLLAAFVLGAVLGLWYLPIAVGPEMQRLRLQRDEARTEAAALRAELGRLQELQRKRLHEPVIHRVVVQLDGPDRAALAVRRGPSVQPPAGAALHRGRGPVPIRPARGDCGA